MTDNDSSTLREPFLPPGDDYVVDEDHPQRHCQSTNSSFREKEEFPAEQRERNNNTNGNADDGNGNGQSNGDNDSRWSTTSQDPNSYPSDVLATAEKNVRRSLAIVFGDFATKSIWNQSLLSVFVVLVWRNRPEYVGIVQATLGLCQTTSSVAATWLSTRRYNHNHNSGILTLFLKLASLAGLCVTIVSLCVIAMQDPRWAASTSSVLSPIEKGSTFLWFLLANGLWGVFWGVTESALSIVLVESAIVAPSTTTQLTIREWHRRVELGGFFGTLLALVFFVKLGNEWTIQNCLVVMTCGVACNLFGVVLLRFLRPMAFDDDDDDWDGSTGEEASPEQPRYEPLLPQDEERIDENYVAAGSSSTEGRFLIPRDDDDDDEGALESTTDEAETSVRISICCADEVRVPLLIHLSDALSSLAGGMSSWYFPLFLVQLLHLRPVSVQCLCLIIPMGQRLSPFLANQLANAIGPCLACISMQWTYVSLLLSMMACLSRGYSVWKICALYVLHGSLMNSTSSLSQSLIAQHVPFEEQHRWDKAETFQKLMWSCSGILGGCVASSKWGLVANFYSTAILQFLACLPLVVLYSLKDPRLEDAYEVDSNESLSSRGEEEEGEDDVDGNDESSPRESTSNWCKPTATKGPSMSDSGNQEASTPSTEATESVESDGDSSSDSMAPTTWVV
jgi:hypothetical protein